MKTIFRTLGLVAAMTAIFAVGGTRALAQDACNDIDSINALYQKVLDNYKNPDTLEVALNAAKEFLEKYGNCDVAKQNSEWLKGRVPVWEKAVPEYKKRKDMARILAAWDKAIQSKNWDAAYAAGNEFASKYQEEPEFVSFVGVPMGLIGLYQSYPPTKNYKYNADTVKYANIALNQIKSGKLSVKRDKAGKDLPDTFGVFEFECKKDECVSELTYALAYLTYHVEGKKPEGLAYYYQVSKLPGRNKNNPLVYETIGAYYYDTVKKLADEVKAMYADQKETDPEDVRTKKEADIKAKLALLNGYAERAMDAYSRAYTLAKADTSAGAKTYADSLYKTLQGLYTVRFQKQDGLDTWIANTIKNPLPDPASTVTPITDADTSSSTVSGPGTGVGNANGTGVGTGNGTGVGAANGRGVGAGNGTGTGNPTGAKTATTKPIKPRR